MIGSLNISGSNIPLNHSGINSVYQAVNISENNNTAPDTPQPPEGPIAGDAGVEYSFLMGTNDPNNDDVYYMIKWENTNITDWQGPYPSGQFIHDTHIWNCKGRYQIQVKAKDIHGCESNWSNPHTIDIAGSYLTIKNISEGFGITIEIKNIGEKSANNVVLSLVLKGGFTTRFHQKEYFLSSLSPNQTTNLELAPKGIGLGIFTDPPELDLSVKADYAKTRGKTIIFRNLGSFVHIIGQYWNTDEAYPGYSLYSPMMSPYTFLINNSGLVQHSWESDFKPALSVYLLENGNLLRTAFPGFNPRFWGGGIGGLVELFDWNNTKLWSFRYSNSYYCLHHDIEYLPNGNILMIAWEYKSSQEAISNGRNPNTLPMGEMWPDHIIEVQPTGPTTGIIVWEWHLWDHLIQDFDPTKENFGIIEEHPELININYGGRVLADWTHINSIDYHEELDQILLSVLNFNEIWVIDHSTTTEEATGHAGGRYGKGGDLLYRWGNPQTYNIGLPEDQRFFQQHDAHWIPTDCPGTGNILIFNNGRGRFEGDYSSIDEITPPIKEDGTYNYTTGATYGPDTLSWQYISDNPLDFYAINLAGSQRLPNGNTLICNGPNGHFFEVTSQKEIVWEYINPEPSLFDNHVFRVKKYPIDYPGVQFE